MEVVHNRCCFYALEYHIVWCVKYRRKVLTPEVKSVLIDVLKDYAATNGFEIAEVNADVDHIHLLIQATPMTCIPDIMKGMKGVSARMLFKTFPELKSRLWGGHMWNPSYFIATASDRTEEQIAEYIRSQKEQ